MGDPWGRGRAACDGQPRGRAPGDGHLGHGT
jgi:hypothetical protein